MREAILERGPRIRRVVLMAVVIGGPTLFLRITHDPFNVPKLALLITGVAVAAGIKLIEIIQGSFSGGLKRLIVPAALLAAPLVLSWILSPYKPWSLMGLHPRFEGLLPYLLTIALGLLLVDAFVGRAGELAVALSWAGAIVGGYAVIQLIGLDPFRWSLFGAPTEAVSTTGNPNFTGGFLGIVVPVCLSLVLTDPARRRVAIRLLIATVLGWIASRSQGGWAAGIAGCALVMGYLFVDRVRFARWIGAAIALLAAGVTIGVVLIAMVQPSGRFTIDTALVRARWWQSAGDMGMSHPLAGRGPNSFTVEGAGHRPLADALRFGFDFPDDPHSVPFAMFANLGVPGLLGFLGILGWTIWYFIRGPDPSLLQVGFFGAVVAYFVQASVSIDELTLRVGLWVGLAGLASFDTNTSRKKQTAASRPRAKKGKRARPSSTPLRAPALVAVASVLVGIMLVWAGTLVIADAQVRAGLNAFAQGEPSIGRSRFSSALALRDSADYRAQLAFELRDIALGEEPREDFLKAASAEFQASLDNAPYVFVIASYGRMLDRYAAETSGSGDPEAVDLLRRALKVDPLNPLIRADLAAALNHLDRYDEAIEMLRPQVDFVPTDQYGPYWAALALAAAKEGDIELAERALAVAITVAPDDDFTQQAQRLLKKGS